MEVPPDTPSAATPSAGTSLTLLERLRGNDPEAWERVVRLYGPLVLFWGRRAGLNEADAADVLQDVFRSVSGAIGRFRRDQETDTFRGWLWVIARNKLRDYFRAAAQQPAAAGGTDAQDRLAQVPEDEPDSSPDAEPSRGLLHRALESVRAGFEDRTWAAFWRTTVDGLPPGRRGRRTRAGAGFRLPSPVARPPPPPRRTRRADRLTAGRNYPVSARRFGIWWSVRRRYTVSPCPTDQALRVTCAGPSPRLSRSSSAGTWTRARAASTASKRSATRATRSSGHSGEPPPHRPRSSRPC